MQPFPHRDKFNSIQFNSIQLWSDVRTYTNFNCGPGFEIRRCGRGYLVLLWRTRILFRRDDWSNKGGLYICKLWWKEVTDCPSERETGVLSNKFSQSPISMHHMGSTLTNDRITQWVWKSYTGYKMRAAISLREGPGKHTHSSTPLDLSETAGPQLQDNAPNILHTLYIKAHGEKV